MRHATSCSSTTVIVTANADLSLVIDLIAFMQDAHVQAMLQQALRSNLTIADTTSAAESLVEAKPEASPKPCSPSRLDNEHMQQEACSAAEGAVRVQEHCSATKVQESAQLASDSLLTDFPEQQLSTGSLSCLHRRSFCT